MKGRGKIMNCKPGKKTLGTVMFLMSGIVLAEIVIGFYTNTKTLLVESFHSMTDLGSVMVVVISYHISTRQWTRSTFGFARAEVVGMFVNCVFFVGSCLTIAISCISEFIQKTPILMPKLLLFIGSLGISINIIELIMFHFFRNKTSNLNHLNHSHSHIVDWLPSGNENGEIEEDDHSFQRLGCKSILLVIMNDAVGSFIVVLLGGVFVIFENEDLYYLDPACALLLICIIIYTMWPIFKESGYILMQNVPLNITITDLKNRLISEIPEILSIHELHIWQLAGNKVIATVHICCANLENYIDIERKAKDFFIREGVYCTTIQPEFKSVPCPLGSNFSDDQECLLICPSWDRSCLLRSCCGQLKHPELFDTD